MLRKQIAIHRGDEEEDEAEGDNTESLFKYAVGAGALIVAAAALYKTR